MGGTTRRNPDVPCYDCTERNEICHTTAYGCERWAKYREKHDAELAERAAKYELNTAIAGYEYDNVTKKLRRRRRS